MSERPSRIEINWARDLLLDHLLGDFPFADGPSKANALAALLLPFARPMIDGPTPLHLIDAPTQGTGKTLLSQVMGTRPWDVSRTRCRKVETMTSGASGSRPRSCKPWPSS